MTSKPINSNIPMSSQRGHFIFIPETFFVDGGKVNIDLELTGSNGGVMYLKGHISMSSSPVLEKTHPAPIITESITNWPTPPNKDKFDLDREKVQTLPLELRSRAPKNDINLNAALKGLGLPSAIGLYNKYRSHPRWNGFNDFFGYSCKLGRGRNKPRNNVFNTTSTPEPTTTSTQGELSFPIRRGEKPKRRDLNDAFRLAGLPVPSFFAVPESWESLKELINDVKELRETEGWRS